MPWISMNQARRASTYRAQRWTKAKRYTSGQRRKYINKRRARTSVAAEVKRVLNGRTGGYVGLEKKFFDTSDSSTIITATDAAGGEVDPSTLDCLNCPAQGDGESQRDGRQIAMDSITIKGVVSIASQADQGAGDTVPDIMIALVLDKQTNGVTLSSEDVYENPSGLGLLAAQPFRNLEYTARFRVLKTVKISAAELAGAIQPVFDGTNIEQQGAQVPFSMYVKLNGMQTNFLSGQTTSVIAAIADKSLHMIAFASNVSMVPTLVYNSRLRFTG